MLEPHRGGARWRASRPSPLDARYARAFATTVAGTSSAHSLCTSGWGDTFPPVISTTLSLVVDRQTGSVQRLHNQDLDATRTLQRATGPPSTMVSAFLSYWRVPLRATSIGVIARAIPLHPPGAPEVDASRQPERRDGAVSNSVAAPGQAAVPDEASVLAHARAAPANRPTQLGRRSAQSDSQRPRRRAAEFAQKQPKAAAEPTRLFARHCERAARRCWHCRVARSAALRTVALTRCSLAQALRQRVPGEPSRCSTSASARTRPPRAP